MAANLLAIDPLEYDPTRVLAQFRSIDGAFPQAGTPIAGATVGRQFASDGWFELQVGAGQTVSSVLSNLSTRADVLASTPDFKITANLTPNDPSYPSLWGMEQPTTRILMRRPHGTLALPLRSSLPLSILASTTTMSTWLPIFGTTRMK